MPQGTNGILFGQIVVVIGVTSGGVWAATFASWIDVDFAQAMRKCSSPLSGTEGIVPRICKSLGRPSWGISSRVGYWYSVTGQVYGLART